MNSDHTPIHLILCENIIQKENNPVLVNKRTDWESFRHSLERKINLMVPLRNEEQLDGEVEKFLVDSQQSAWENTPEIKRTNGKNYPKEIRDLIAEKRKARRKWQQTRDLQDKTEFNNLAQQLQREIKELSNDSVSFYLREITNDNNTDYSLWKATKNFIDRLCRFPQSGKQMGRGLGTMDKIHNDLLNIWNIYCDCKRDRKKQKRQPKTLFKKMKK